MRVVVQRVSHATCTMDGQVTGSIQEGFLVLVGFAPNDTQAIVDKMIHKIINLRVFGDENGKMNLSIQSINGAILSISQFTLYADCKKGNRPSFVKAAKPDIAIPLYDSFNASLQAKGIDVQTGIFGADMKIDLCNDGPVTIVLDSEEICK